MDSPTLPRRGPKRCLPALRFIPVARFGFALPRRVYRYRTVSAIRSRVSHDGVPSSDRRSYALQRFRPEVNCTHTGRHAHAGRRPRTLAERHSRRSSTQESTSTQQGWLLCTAPRSRRVRPCTPGLSKVMSSSMIRSLGPRAFAPPQHSHLSSLSTGRWLRPRLVRRTRSGTTGGTGRT